MEKNNSEAKTNVLCLNAWTTALALFFGWTTAFAAFASFFPKWSFNPPFSRLIISSNVGIVNSLLVFGLISIALSAVALITLKKTQKHDFVGRTWKTISNVFLILTAFYTVNLLAIAIYSLLAIGTKGIQGQLWLSNFIPTAIVGIGSASVCVLTRLISKNNKKLNHVICHVAAALSLIALVLTIIHILTSFYGGGSYSQYLQIYDAIR